MKNLAANYRIQCSGRIAGHGARTNRGRRLGVAGEPGQTTIYDELAYAFNTANPDAKITVVKNSSDLFNPALVPALSAGEGS